MGRYLKNLIIRTRQAELEVGRARMRGFLAGVGLAALVDLVALLLLRK